jgi:hypothetical protein
MKRDVNPKEEKIANLRSMSPEAFGNTGVRGQQHANNVNVDGLNMERVEGERYDNVM